MRMAEHDDKWVRAVARGSVLKETGAEGKAKQGKQEGVGCEVQKNRGSAGTQRLQILTTPSLAPLAP
jgi:hypothetical protein